MTKGSGWEKETDLCADFIAWARNEGWVVYAECGGWDILLVRPSDGFQIGVEAKLQLNAKVLCQALKSGFLDAGEVGPDCRAILVPAVKSVGGLEVVARHLGVAVIEASKEMSRRRVDGAWQDFEVATFDPRLPEKASLWWRETWPEWSPDCRVKLPEYVPDVIAGDSGPVMLTDWKIKALKVVVVIEMMGSVTRADMRALRIDPSRWTQYWLRSDGSGGWVPRTDPNSRMPDFKAQHPINYEQIKADWPKWSTALPPRLLSGAA
jgi:hypothetical protein